LAPYRVRLPTHPLNLCTVGKRNVLANGTCNAQGRFMTEKDVAALSSLVTKHEATLLTWVRNQVDAGSFRTGQIKEDELTGQSQRFLGKFVKALKDGQADDTAGPAWSAARLTCVPPKHTPTPHR
jgi:hypothetical protein